MIIAHLRFKSTSETFLTVSVSVSGSTAVISGFPDAHAEYDILDAVLCYGYS